MRVNVRPNQRKRIKHFKGKVLVGIQLSGIEYFQEDALAICVCNCLSDGNVPIDLMSRDI